MIAAVGVAIVPRHGGRGHGGCDKGGGSGKFQAFIMRLPGWLRAINRA